MFLLVNSTNYEEKTSIFFLLFVFFLFFFLSKNNERLVPFLGAFLKKKI